MAIVVGGYYCPPYGNPRKRGEFVGHWKGTDVLVMNA
jgi:hypothetical protein